MWSAILFNSDIPLRGRHDKFCNWKTGTRKKLKTLALLGGSVS